MADLSNRYFQGSTIQVEDDGSVRVYEANRSTRWAKDSVDNNILYVGEAAANASETDAVWNIFKLDSTNGKYLFSLKRDGNQYDQKWSDRETLTYA